MTFSRILVPYDQSKYSDLAFNKALEIATKFSSTITVLNILEVEPVEGHFKPSMENLETEQDNRIKEAKSMLENLQSKAKEKNVPMESKVLHNPSPSDGILAYVESEKINLIVMGSHGRTGFKKIVLGSVANDVLSKSKCPVLIIKNEE